jgi:small-conductance mechanosensitive channel
MVRRLVGPVVIFAAFAALAGFRADVLAQFGSDASAQAGRVVTYASQAGLWLASAYLLNRLLAVFLWDLVVQRALGNPVPRLLRDVVATVIYGIALTGILAFVFQRSVTGVWATSGVIGIVLGFALRSLILDVFTGLAINVDRPYRIGDWVLLHQRQPNLHIIGNVVEVNWRTTRLRTIENNLVIVPNSVMGSTIITNFMRPDPKSRLELDFCLEHAVPTERALRVLTAGVRAVTGGAGRVLADPPPKVRINRITDQGVEYRVRYWVLPAELSPNKSRHLVLASVLDHLAHAGMTLAYPKRDVFHARMPQRQLDTASLTDRAALLSRIELFERLSATELRTLAERVDRREYAEGTTLIQQGDPGESMFVLVEGLVHVYTANDGAELKVAQVVPGEFFGEMSLLTGEARSATARAAASTITYEITKEHMSTLLSARPELVGQLSAVVAHRRLRNVRAVEAANDERQDAEEASVARQLVTRMRTFFRLR